MLWWSSDCQVNWVNRQHCWTIGVVATSLVMVFINLGSWRGSGNLFEEFVTPEPLSFWQWTIPVILKTLGSQVDQIGWKIGHVNARLYWFHFLRFEKFQSTLANDLWPIRWYFLCQLGWKTGHFRAGFKLILIFWSNFLENQLDWSFLKKFQKISSILKIDNVSLYWN